MIIRNIVFSINPPEVQNVLWIKAGINNINTLYIYDNGWRKIGTSSGGSTSDYNSLENKPKINNVTLNGNLTLEELGIIIPDISAYITNDALNKALAEYAKKNEIPSINGLLSKNEASQLYQSKGEYALKTEIPDVSKFITSTVNNLANYYTKAEIENKLGGIGNLSFKVVESLPLTGEANCIYLVPNKSQVEKNIKDEFLWIEGKWESIGNTDIDLSSYAKKVDIADMLTKTEAQSKYQPKGEYLTSIPAEYITETALNNKGYLTTIVADGKYQEKGNYALKTELPDTSTLATKEELKAKADTTYVNSELSKKANISAIPDVSNLATKIELANKVDNSALSSYATKEELNSKPSLNTINSTIDSKINAQEFKTINGQTIKGNGNIEVSGGGQITVDKELNPTSDNPIANSAIAELLMKLDDKIFPITLSVSGGGTYDEGTTQTITVTWNLKKDGQSITPDKVTINGETVTPSDGYKVYVNVTTTTTYTVVATYKGKQYTSRTYATFRKVYYRYVGTLEYPNPEFAALTSGYILQRVNEGKITKERCTDAAATLQFSIPDGIQERAVYLYPFELGKISKVKDVAAGMYSTDWEMSNTIDIENTQYYVVWNTKPLIDYTGSMKFEK